MPSEPLVIRLEHARGVGVCRALVEEKRDEEELFIQFSRMRGGFHLRIELFYFVPDFVDRETVSAGVEQPFPSEIDFPRVVGGRRVKPGDVSLRGGGIGELVEPLDQVDETSVYAVHALELLFFDPKKRPVYDIAVVFPVV
jgi:hypothetical protein